MFKFWQNFFKLTRPLSNVKNVALILIAFYFSKSEFDLWLILRSLLSLSLVCSSFYTFNTISDLDSDKNNENKKHYLEAVRYFGQKKSFVIFIALLVAGLFIGYFINLYFFVFLLFLALTDFLYSFKYTRFKEKIILDILFGASFTFLLRFVAAWFIFSKGFPSLLPMLALVFGKTDRYSLYKGIDRERLLDQNIKNTITFFSLRSLFIFSFFFLILTIVSIILMFLNLIYFQIDILGSIPIQALFLIPFIVPPIIIIFFQIIKKTKFENSFLRFWGYIYMFLVLVITYWVLL